MAANSEQLLAIEHKGGVLLSAGAGSGKTFVLVEHLIYLIRTFFEENKHLSETDKKRELRYYLSSIVMMTFTKKAAGELETRIKKRVSSEVEIDNRFQVALSELGFLSVTTIHGFCYKLVKQGVSPTLDRHSEMVSETRLFEEIVDLVVEWADIETKNGESHARFVGLMKKEISQAIYSILFTPELRTLWLNNDFSNPEKDLSRFFKDYILLNGLETIFETSPDLSPYKDSAWKKFIESFEEVKRTSPLQSINALENYFELFTSVSRFPSISKKESVDESVRGHLSKMKDFRDLFKKIIDDLRYFNDNFEDFKLWPKLFNSLFKYVEKRYSELSLLSFSDLEYEVYLALSDKETQKRVSNEYQYLIVDEFQDTSRVQFEIIRKIINNDFSRLFAVGDPKQAIYGFRGGELGVFHECEKLIPLNLSLLNNYRSSKKIIEFNNELFKTLFPLGEGYTGIDPYFVPPKGQKVPENKEVLEGSVFELQVDINEESATSTEIDQFEAQGILKIIKDIRKQYPNEKIAILYRNLTPVRYLANLLLKEEISFSAQIKIPFHEDPIVSIFKMIAEYSLDHKRVKKVKRDEEIAVGINLYLEALGFKITKVPVLEVQMFFKESELYGLNISFSKLLWRLGVANSFHQENESIMKDIFLSAGGDLEEAYLRLSKIDKKYGADFKVGNKSNEIEIMTSHASKGLEFPHVILGGIHTNGRKPPKRYLLGKNPLSFRWKSSAHDKESKNSPELIYEKAFSDFKDFSEAKRLFYVATTRAVKSLSWCSVVGSEENELAFGQNGWITGLRRFHELMPSEVRKTEHFAPETITKNSSSLPLFHQDSLGIVSTPPGRDLIVSGELSVTRLSTVVQCPRKFYLQNICRINQDEVGPIETGKAEVSKDERLLEGQTSNAERGSEIHALLSDLVDKRKVIDDLLASPFISPIKFAYSEIEKYKEAKLLSEKIFKFTLMGQMVTGIIDLLVVPQDNSPIEIWDFKTGKRSEEKETPYLFQLKSYAKALHEHKLFNEGQDVVLKILYLDSREIVQHKIGINDLLSYFEEQKGLFLNLDKINRNHCRVCPYQPLCAKSF